MSLTLDNVGGTLTSGTSVNLTFAGNANGLKASFITPNHGRLTTRQIDFLTSPAKTTPADPGVARAGLKITFGDRTSDGDCCTVKAGSVIIDLGVRWSLNQPDTLVDDAVEYLQALVFSPSFTSAIKQGILPQ